MNLSKVVFFNINDGFHTFSGDRAINRSTLLALKYVELHVVTFHMKWTEPKNFTVSWISLISINFRTENVM